MKNMKKTKIKNQKYQKLYFHCHIRNINRSIERFQNDITLAVFNSNIRIQHQQTMKKVEKKYV